MKSSEQINELAEALAKAQAAFPSVAKKGKSHTGKYATLDDVLEAIRKPLSDNGLSFVQMPTDGKSGVGLWTRLMHSSGQWLEEVFSMPAPGGRMNEAQAYGASLTYARRYALSAMLGIATEEDTDVGVKQEPRKKQPVAPPPPPTNYSLKKAAGDTGDMWGPETLIELDRALKMYDWGIAHKTEKETE
jgi:hypothetical protein